MGFKSGEAAIVGLGLTDMTRRYTKPALTLGAEAIMAAAEDAGIEKAAIDGLLVNIGMSDEVNLLNLQASMGLRDLRLGTNMSAGGSTAGQMVQYAAMAVQAGLATAVACVYADAPLAVGQKGSDAYGMRSGRGGPRIGEVRLGGQAGLNAAYGFFGANTGYALAATRHMALYGTTQDQFGRVALSTRQWASKSPLAVYREPITMDDYHASRWVVEPFHLLDCCMVVNGAVAVIVTTSDRAKTLKQPPVYILGMGQGHPGNARRAGYENEISTGAVFARNTAFPMAGITNEDVDVCELYDCYTYTTIVTLEDYGFCKKGEGGPFVGDGKLGPGGSLPTNTGGGQLSGYYMWGMTPISEAVIQTRGQGEERQAPKNDVVLVSCQGGTLDYHSCLILSPASSS